MLKLSLPLRLALTAILNSILAYCLDRYFPQYVTVFGGVGAYVVIGSLLTLMNFLVRPLLNIVTFPLHLVFTLFTTIAVNILFLWFVYQITLQMDPNIIALTITGGIGGWLTLSTMLGVVNWLLKHIL